MSKHMIRHDPQRCISCKACEVHCQVKNRTARRCQTRCADHRRPRALGEKVQITSAFRPCFHCEKPWCVAVCPTGAMVKRDEERLGAHCQGSVRGVPGLRRRLSWKVPQWDESSGKVGQMRRLPRSRGPGAASRLRGRMHDTRAFVLPAQRERA